MGKRKLGYLSGAPRVSTNPQADASGARSHVVGVMEAFESLGWGVDNYIVGDHVPQNWTDSKSQVKLRQHILIRTAADILRILLSYKNRHSALRVLGTDLDWVYERMGAFQSLGRAFQKKGIPWILETNAPLFFEAKSDRKSVSLSKIARQFEYFAYKQCDVLICVTDILKDIIINEFDIAPEKIVVVPNGVNVEQFSPEKADPIKFFDFPTIIFVGSVRRWQGLQLLLEAIASLKCEDIKYGLVIVGDGPNLPDCKRIVEQKKIKTQVEFTGHVPWTQVPDLITGADLGYSGRITPEFGQVYFSPLKLYEYQSMAKPVIAAAHKDAQSLIVPRETGYLFEPENLNDLISTLRFAYQDNQRWPDMGKKARDIVIKHHSWKSRVRDMLIPKAERVLASKPQ